jgi:putative flippase GtrA
VLSFAVVNGLAVVQTLAVSLFLAGWALPRWGLRAHAEAIAHAVGVAVPVLTSFLAHRAVTFR